MKTNQPLNIFLGNVGETNLDKSSTIC